MGLLHTNPSGRRYRWVLPLVRRGGNPVFNNSDLGLLTHDRGKVLPVVYIGNLIDVRCPEDLRRCSREEYPNLEALFSEWKVD